MAELIDVDGESKQIEDGADLQETLDEMGVAFGCANGVCHSCRIEVIEGQENLSEMTELEKHGGLERSPDRLACQCKIKQGAVKYRY